MQRLNVFFAGANGDFVEAFYDDEWNWNNHGLPPNTQMGSPAGAIVRVKNGVQPLNVFFAGANGSLIEAFWDGNNWNWSDHGLPPDTLMAAAPAVISWVQDGVEHLDVFFQGADGNLIEALALFGGPPWQWIDHGLPPNTQMAGTPTAVAWFENAVQNGVGVLISRLNMFFTGANGNLIERWWDGNQWNWTDHGTPPNAQVAVAPAIVGWTQDGVQRFNVFLFGDNGDLIERWWDGIQWNWADHGAPPNAQTGSTPAIVGWLQQDGVQRFNLFALGVPPGNLIERWWDGNQWNWTDHGLPPNAPMGSAPAAVSWSDNGVERLNVFARDLNGSLIERWWDGNQWQWNDHGAPPDTQMDTFPAAVTWTE